MKGGSSLAMSILLNPHVESCRAEMLHTILIHGDSPIKIHSWDTRLSKLVILMLDGWSRGL